MAIEAFMLEALRSLVEHRRLPNKRVLCLGYPDLLTHKDAWPGVAQSPEAQRIKLWHSWRGAVLDTADFFAKLGLEADYVDRAEIRGGEIACDLNLATLSRGYGLIIDPGTTEHVFNIGHVFAEIVRSLTPGGVVMHTNPLNMGNHGFWSLHPTAYEDFYALNGCEVVFRQELFGPLQSRGRRPVSATKRFDTEANSAMFVVAHKLHDVPAILWPVQTKYRENPTLKGAA